MPDRCDGLPKPYGARDRRSPAPSSDACGRSRVLFGPYLAARSPRLLRSRRQSHHKTAAKAARKNTTRIGRAMAATVMATAPVSSAVLTSGAPIPAVVTLTTGRAVALAACTPPAKSTPITTVEQAKSELRRVAGTQLDPKIVKVFLSLLSDEGKRETRETALVPSLPTAPGQR